MVCNKKGTIRLAKIMKGPKAVRAADLIIDIVAV